MSKQEISDQTFKPTHLSKLSIGNKFIFCSDFIYREKIVTSVTSLRTMHKAIFSSDYLPDEKKTAFKVIRINKSSVQVQSEKLLTNGEHLNLVVVTIAPPSNHQDRKLFNPIVRRIEG